MIFDATEGAQQVPGGERGTSVDHTPWYQKPWVQNVINGLIGLIAAIGLFFGWRSYVAQKGKVTTRSETEATYHRFAQALAKHAKLRRVVGQTPQELYLLVRPNLGSLEPKANELNRRLIVSLYGPNPMTEPELRAIQAELVRFLRELGKLRA